MTIEADEQPRSTEDLLEARLERLRGIRAWSASGPVEDFAATEATGFEPAGQVFAGTVFHFGYTASRARCTGAWGYTPRTDLASAGGPFNTLLRQLYGARRTVLARAVAECEALGADGIIAARLEAAEHPAGGLAITLEGTAVRARSAVRPAAPFTTHVTPQDFAKLLHSGWMPFALVYGIAIASRHDDKRTWEQTRRGFGASANREIRSYSHLVNDARRDARKQLHASVEASGGEGVVVDTVTLAISERECPSNEGEHDHVAQATVTGTAIVRLDARPMARAPLAIMRLNPRDRTPAPPAETPGLIERDTEASMTDRVANRLAARQRRKDVFRSDNSD